MFPVPESIPLWCLFVSIRGFPCGWTFRSIVGLAAFTYSSLMFTVIIVTIVLTVLYGLAWHDQPNKRENSRRADLR